MVASVEKLAGIVLDEAGLDWEGWNDPALEAKSRVRWKILMSGDRMQSRSLSCGVAEIDPGEKLLLHHHAPDEIYYILDGRGETEIDGVLHDVGPGTTLFIPGNAKHRTWARGDRPLRFFFVFPTATFSEIEYVYDE